MSGRAQGSITLNPAFIQPGFPGNAADNGLSVDPLTTHIVLGDPLGATGPANLLNSREIFLDAFTLRLTQRNTSGFSDWQTEWQNNFLLIHGVGNNSNVLFSTDFPGNTGIYISNDRSAGGWVPPFIILQDSILGNFGRLQFSANDAMEITDATPTHAFAFFQSGNAAIQPAGLADPGFRFTITGIPAQPLMQISNPAGLLLLVDPSTAAYKFGDIANSMHLNIDAGNTTAEFRNPAGRFLSLNANADFYEIGDLDILGAGTRLSINNAAGTVDFSNAALTAAFSINGNPGASGNFTTVDLKTVTVIGGIITSIV